MANLTPVTAKHLVLGIDGADLGLVRAIGPERLPSLHALMARGAFAALESVLPFATLPNWTTFLTGVDPGRHGVFDFTVREGYRVRFAAGTVRAAPTLAKRLDDLGLSCACIAFPGTYPPEQLVHGVFVSGWDAPVAFEADRSYVWPPSVERRLRAKFGPMKFDDVDEFDAASPGWHDRLAPALEARVERRCELAKSLLTEREWDAFLVYFGETDTAAHHLYSLFDARSPRHPDGSTAAQRDALPRVYAAVDRAIGELLASAGGDRVEVTVVSDHGSGGASDKVVHLNRALAEAGLLSFRASRFGGASALKDLALTKLPPRLRERAFRAAGAALPGLVESHARFGAIDMSRTVAFSDELNYFPAVHLNVRGREPEGIVAPEDVPKITRKVEHALLALRDPWNGAPIVRAVHRREAIYDGPFVERAPDLVIELALDGDYSYNLLPSTAPRTDDAPSFRKLQPSDYLGRKGRSLPGSHRARGLFVAAGPSVRPCGEVRAKIADASATFLARMNVALPAHASGHPLDAILEGRKARPKSAPPPSTPFIRKPRDKREDERRLASRLRSLGYIE